MRFWKQLRLRWRSLRKQDRADNDLSRELQFHLEQQTDELTAGGMNRAEARQTALRMLGGEAQIKEECRDMRRVNHIENLIKDVQYAFRSLRKHPGFNAVAVLSLALGIGANTALFSVIDAVLLKPLPYPHPDRLARLWQKFPAVGEERLDTSPPEYLDYRDRTRAFSSLAGYQAVDYDLTGEAEPERLVGCLATGSLFTTLQTAPLLGRSFLPTDEKPGAAPVVILSYEYWQRRFGGSSSVLGSVLKLNETSYRVIGVMPAGFTFPATSFSVGEPPTLWAPLIYTPKEIADRASSFDTSVIGRMKDGISIEQARDDVSRTAEQFQREHSDIYNGNIRLVSGVEPWGADARSRVRPVLYTLAGAVGFVLLIACANLANLLLARLAARQREMAVRRALGASSGRLTRQLITESVLLTSLGGVLGCLLAYGLTGAARHLWSAEVNLNATHVNASVLAFTCALSLLTGLLCGLAPAWNARKLDVNNGLKQAGRSAGASRERQRLRAALVVVEAASAALLLIGAGLFLHSFVQVLRVPSGFNPKGSLLVRTTFNRSRYPDPPRRRAALRTIAERLRALPGVNAVAVTTHVPLADQRSIGFVIDGHNENEPHWAANALVSEEYFRSTGIPILAGRTFNGQDTPASPIAAIVNEALARRYWPGESAVGKGLSWGGLHLTVVGVAGDVHIKALDAEVEPTIYHYIYQLDRGPTSSGVFLIHSTLADPGSLGNAARNAIWSVDAGLPVFGTVTFEQVVSRSLAARRLAVILIAGFAGLALLLAMIGLYGVLSYAVAQRTQEMGLRLALGAPPRQLIRLVVSEGARLACAGLALGLIAGAASASAVQKLLFGIRALDSLAFGGAAALLLLIAVFASYLPARRASRVDPLVALRDE